MKGDANMKLQFSEIRSSISRVVPTVVEVSITINRVILLAYCNLTLAFIVLIFEKGGEHVKKLSRSAVVIALLAIIVMVGWVYNSYAYDTHLEPIAHKYFMVNALGVREDQNTQMMDIVAQATKVSTIEASLAVKRAHLIHDMRAVLTQVQLQKLSELEEERIDAKVDRHLFRLA